MISSLDDDFIESIIEKYGSDLQKINLSNNGELLLKTVDNLGIVQMVYR